MDLTLSFPTSPRERMCGIVHIPRMIDKARAFRKNAMGEYIYPCPLDKMILNFLRTDPVEFCQYVVDHDRGQIEGWVAEKSMARSESEKEFLNRQILERAPDSEDRWKYFYEIRDKIDPSRTDITTWVDLIDLEEGRLQPKAS
ncbi:MAG: DUF5069 domain-containing protein [Nitrospinae bacterium]|nr:DUF5069 domain-containing protein [Nitrospinota bacterium]